MTTKFFQQKTFGTKYDTRRVANFSININWVFLTRVNVPGFPFNSILHYQKNTIEGRV